MYNKINSLKLKLLDNFNYFYALHTETVGKRYCCVYMTSNMNKINNKLINNTTQYCALVV